MPSVLAIVCVRNEAVHIERCLRDLIASGCEVRLIDNASSDGTRDLAASFLGGGLLSIHDLPWHGSFSLSDQMAAKKRLFGEASHDWVVHADADEWLVTGVEGETLSDAISAADADGYNVINFHELAFLPAPGENFERADYALRMTRYYFYQKNYPRLNRAWKRSLGFDNSASGGHRLIGVGVNRSPRDLFLRHYIVLSDEHARRKYVGRAFSSEDLGRGWHRSRRTICEDNVRLRDGAVLRTLSHPGSNDFDLSAPTRTHYWEWD